MPFDLSEVVLDPDLCVETPESVVIIRTTVQFGLGGVQENQVLVPAYGVVTVASPNALSRIAEGDRIKGALEINCTQKIFQTQEGVDGSPNTSYLSDILVWHDQQYKVIDVSPWRDFGFWQAILVRIEGV